LTDIVINTDYGGFGLSAQAIHRLFDLKRWKLVESVQGVDGNWTIYYKSSVHEDNVFWENDLERDDPDLVKVVRELGKQANGHFASLKIVTIPKEVEWEIVEYDGMEHVAEKHRVWR
jgi:hypothetical protein